MADFDGRTAADMRPAWGVAALLLAAADALSARLGAVAVRGEISSFSRAASGHCYLSLKDAEGAPAVLRCAMFRRAAALLDFDPRDGMQVEVRGRVSVYEPRGELQLVVESMRRLGAGTLYEEFLRLRALLERQGLFDPARRRAVPPMPRRVAVVTSPAAAAWQDVMAAFARRSPHVELVLVPSPVQGKEAPAALAAALQRAALIDGVDTVLLVRGGGSLEDLWAFNDERVVRALAACVRPVVCGVGHESDVTLCDLAADLRAPTPTAAAELAAPAAADLTAELDRRMRALRLALQRQLERQAQRLDGMALRLGPAAAAVASQHQRLHASEQRLRAALAVQLPRRREELAQRAQRLRRAVQLPLERAAARLTSAGERLQALDPRAVLQRGYVWVQDEAGQPVLSAAALSPGQQVLATWADGSAGARIESVSPSSQDGAMDIAPGPGRVASRP